MEDSVKGLYLTLTIIFIFMLCIIQFMTLFPLEQGINVSANSGADAQKYLTMASIDSNPTQLLTTVNNQSQEGFDKWDVTQGFMGSNTLKQSSKGGFLSQINLVFSNLKTMATSLFGLNSPVMIVLGILLTTAIGYLTYMIIKWIRTGL